MIRSLFVVAFAVSLIACGEVKPPEIVDAAQSIDAPDVDAAIDAPDVDAAIDAPGMVTLSIVRGGAGTGGITSSPTGIDCGATCAGSFPMGTLVTLTAAPGVGSSFTGWGGACAGSLTTCSVTLNGNTAVNADFGLTQHTVTVALGGNGTGTVTSTTSGINCPGVCTVSVPFGTALTLNAAATGASTFAGWSGAGCTGTGACGFTVTGDTTINASFALNFSLVVTKTGTGTGTVTSTPAGINCGADCVEAYAANTMVTLSAAPAGDSVFAGWSGGGCSGTGACTVTITSAVMVTATFNLQQFTLTVTTGGNGSGDVRSTPSGIICPSDCTESYGSGTMVTLTPTPGTGSVFGSWAGACTGTGACTVTMTAARSVTANFTLTSHTLTVTLAGTGGGTVTSSPSGINCGGDCTEAYLYNTTVTLTATPTGTATFAGWSGACTGATCVVSMTAARAVTATFTAAIAAPNYMFVTSTVATGNLGGLAGADAFCQARANAASLPGTYRAWLSTTTVNAINRFGAATGWIRADGKPFATTAANIGAGLISTPPRINELGADVLEVTAMTATTLGGTFATSTTDCSGWTSTVGSTTGGPTSASSAMFTFYFGTSCAGGGRLYCFGVDRTATVTAPSPPPNRRAFMRLWGPGGGIAAADAACQSDAVANGLPGTYKALLATTTGSALSRFDLTGRPWYRVDNVAVLPTASAWSTATFFDSGTNLTANGSMTFHNYVNWAGAANLTTAGTVASTCANWTATTATAQSGIAGTTRLSLFFSTGSQMCDFGGGTITCLQE